jgi:hypothetical protein
MHRAITTKEETPMPKLKSGDLSRFIGSVEWTRWSPLFSETIASEGMMFVASQGEAFWLLDAIASHEENNEELVAACEQSARFDYLHFWRLTVDAETREARLVCIADEGEPPVVQQDISYTDFPLSELTVYAGNDGPGTPRKLFLPSEY